MLRDKALYVKICLKKDTIGDLRTNPRKTRYFR